MTPLYDKGKQKNFVLKKSRNREKIVCMWLKNRNGVKKSQLKQKGYKDQKIAINCKSPLCLLKCMNLPLYNQVENLKLNSDKYIK